MDYEECKATDKCYEGILPMGLIGMSTTIIQLTMYTSVNYIIPEKYFGTAYGILQAISNVGTTIGSLVIGNILDTDSVNEQISINQY